jgi:hypothetical protein
MFNNSPPPENRAVYGNVEKCRSGQLQMTIWRMRIACCIPKATNTHAGCAVLIAFPLQQSLQERSSMLRYTYNTCFVFLLMDTVILLLARCNVTFAFLI